MTIAAISPKPPSKAAPLTTIAIGASLVSATGAPFSRSVARLAEMGLPAGVIGPVLHVAPVALAVLGFVGLRALVEGRGPQTRAAIYALGGGAIGFFTAFCLDLFVGVIPALERLTGPLQEAGKLDIAAWGVAGVSFFMAAAVGAIAVFGSPAARVMALEAHDPACAEVRARDRPQFAVSAVGMLGQGLFVAALAVAHQLDASASLVRLGVAVAVAVGAAAFAWSSWVLWRQFDEMLRRTVIEAYAWSGLIATVGCLAWAVLESLRLAPPLTAYGAIVALVALQTMVTFAISSNFSMATPPRKARST